MFPKLTEPPSSVPPRAPGSQTRHAPSVASSTRETAHSAQWFAEPKYGHICDGQTDTYLAANQFFRKGLQTANQIIPYDRTTRSCLLLHVDLYFSTKEGTRLSTFKGASTAGRLSIDRKPGALVLRLLRLHVSNQLQSLSWTLNEMNRHLGHIEHSDMQNACACSHVSDIACGIT